MITPPCAGDVLLAVPVAFHDRPDQRRQDQFGGPPPGGRVLPVRSLAHPRRSADPHLASLPVHAPRCRGRITVCPAPAATPLAWSLVVPVKVLARAKSRLATLAGPDRPALALAMAADTVAAALACPEVGQGDRGHRRPAGPRPCWLAWARSSCRNGPGAGSTRRCGTGPAAPAPAGRGPASAALAADLPALRPAELGGALRAAARWPQAFVADAAGSGTTLYAARPGTRIPAAVRPRFGRAAPGGRRGPSSPSPAWPACAAMWTPRPTWTRRAASAWAPAPPP